MNPKWSFTRKSRGSVYFFKKLDVQPCIDKPLIIDNNWPKTGSSQLMVFVGQKSVKKVSLQKEDKQQLPRVVTAFTKSH